MEDKEKPKKPGRACDRLRGELLECLVYSDCVQRVSASTVVIAIWSTVTKYPYLELQQWIFYILYPHSQRGGYILQSPCLSVSPSVCTSVHTFVTDISASTGRNDCTSTSCLPCDLQMNEWGYSQHDVAWNILFMQIFFLSSITVKTFTGLI